MSDTRIIRTFVVAQQLAEQIGLQVRLHFRIGDPGVIAIQDQDNDEIVYTSESVDTIYGYLIGYRDKLNKEANNA